MLKCICKAVNHSLNRNLCIKMRLCGNSTVWSVLSSFVVLGTKVMRWRFEPALVSCRDEWAEAIQMVADSLAKQEEEGILCSPTSQIENVNEEEMDTSISHYKRKVSH